LVVLDQLAVFDADLVYASHDPCPDWVEQLHHFHESDCRVLVDERTHFDVRRRSRLRPPVENAQKRRLDRQQIFVGACRGLCFDAVGFFQCCGLRLDGLRFDRLRLGDTCRNLLRRPCRDRGRRTWTGSLCHLERKIADLQADPAHRRFVDKLEDPDHVVLS